MEEERQLPTVEFEGTTFLVDVHVTMNTWIVKVKKRFKHI